MSIENETQMNPGTEEIQNNTGQECTVTTDSSCCSETMEDAKNAQIHTGEYVTIRCPEGVAWRKIKAPKTTTFVMYTHGGLNTVGHLYDCAGNLIAYSDNVGDDTDFSIKTVLEKDCTYYLRVSLANNCCGSFWLMVGFPLEGITLSKNSIALKSGEYYDLSATISPAVASNHTVVWSSSDESIAVVNQASGLVYARAFGTATIYAKAKEDPNIYATCQVTVGAAVAFVLLDDTALSMNVGDSYRLTETVYPENAINKQVVWSSCCPSVATVDDNGNVHAISKGSAKIIVTTVDGDFTDVCCVTVKNVSQETDNREKVIVKKDDHSFYVKFEDNKVWRYIGLDLAQRSEHYTQLILPTMDRAHYSELIEEEQRYLDNIEQAFTKQQIGFLYLLDPLGIQYYMRTDACKGKSIPETLFFKDNVYKIIFGVSPRLIKVFSDQSVEYYEYEDDILPSVREDFFSDAEVLFGAHLIYDWDTFWMEIASLVVSTLLGIFCPPVATAMSGIALADFLFFAASASSVLSNGVTTYMEEYTKEVNKIAYNNDLSDKNRGEQMGNAAKTAMEWANRILSVFSILFDKDKIFSPPAYDIITYNRVNSSNYSLKYNVNGQELSMEQIISKINMQ